MRNEDKSNVYINEEVIRGSNSRIGNPKSG